MNRRRLLIAGCGCAAGWAMRDCLAQTGERYIAPRRFDRPDSASDEGGLWALMDREERALRRSPLIVRDPGLRDYVQNIVCRLGGKHCPDIRVLLVRTPLFNASMAPNGMMQVWTGLLLRVENEAQLAAVLGHEIGHYLQRHSLERLRDIRAKSAAGQVLGLFGLVGAIGQIAVAASAYAYGREHEREADRIGAQLMHEAGYDVGESARVWGNLLREIAANDGRESNRTTGLFDTHPAPPERQADLAALAKALPGGSKGDDDYTARTRPHLEEWLRDEVKRGQHEESLVLIGRHLERGRAAGLMLLHRGEVYRLRGKEGDLERALADYAASAQADDAPAAAHRGIGLIARQRGQRTEALRALTRYLEMAPDAPDAAFIKSYLSELAS